MSRGVRQVAGADHRGQLAEQCQPRSLHVQRPAALNIDRVLHPPHCSSQHLDQEEVPGGVAEHGPDHLQQPGLGVELQHPRHHVEDLGHVGDGGDDLLERVQGQLGRAPHLLRQLPRLLQVEVVSLREVGRHVRVQGEQLLKRFHSDGFDLAGDSHVNIFHIHSKRQANLLGDDLPGVLDDDRLRHVGEHLVLLELLPPVMGITLLHYYRGSGGATTYMRVSELHEAGRDVEQVGPGLLQLHRPEALLPDQGPAHNTQ